MLLMVLMSEMALLPARFAARAASVTSVMFGVSLVMTGIFATSITQPTIVSATFGLLPDCRAHAALAHAVRATEVQLDAVRARVLGALHEFMPVLARVHHERGDDGVIRPALLDLGDFAEVGFRRAVADEFDVVEPDHARRGRDSAPSSARKR